MHCLTSKYPCSEINKSLIFLFFGTEHCLDKEVKTDFGDLSVPLIAKA